MNAPYKQLMMPLIVLLASLSACQSDTPSEEAMQAFIQKVKGDMVFVEGGTFEMGLPRDALRRGTRIHQYFSKFHSFSVEHSAMMPHEVRLDSFSISKREVSWYEYDMFTNSTGQPIKRKQYREGNNDRISLETSAFSVSWQEAKDYCQWVGKVIGKDVALPTEAQWEFAARARGQDIPFATATGDFTEASKNTPNALGIHQMSGFMAEWVNDWHSDDYYKVSPIDNPKGPEHGTKKILRGSSNSDSPRARNTYKRFGAILKGTAFRGFRCVLNDKKPI